MSSVFFFCFENPISKVDRKTFRILMNKFCKHDKIYVFCNMQALYALIINIMTKSGSLFFSETKVKTLCLPTVNFKVGGGGSENREHF